MKYEFYIAKKRIRTKGICGVVNIPYGTILPSEGGFILFHGKKLCAVTSQNARDYFWGYAQENPDEEIKRQEMAARLLCLAPPGTGGDLIQEDNPWRKYGHLEEIPGVWRWKWDDAVGDFPQFLLEDLIRRIECGATSSGGRDGALHGSNCG